MPLLSVELQTTKQIFTTLKKSIVEFRIPSYPGQSKELDTEVRLMRGKIFRGKIRMYFSVQLYVDRDYDFKKISVKEVESNFVRMKVPESKKYLQVRSISDAYKRPKNF